jgi:hypothetical protein
MIWSQQLLHKIQLVSIMDICNFMLAIGLGSIMIGKLTSPIMNPIVETVISMCGYTIFLTGIAVFVAIARVVLDY